MYSGGKGEGDMVSFASRDVEITATCRLCNSEHTMLVNMEDVYDWRDGKFVQDAFPYLTADEREILISGTCGKCFDSIFGDSEDNDE